MSTVAGNCGSRGGPASRTARLVCALTFCAALGCAIQWLERPCQAQAAAPQNTTPPATPDDPPPSLIKHPKPQPAPPPQPAATPGPPPDSTSPPAQHAPARASGATQGAAAR